jgi:hypothetical protein
MDVRRLRAGEWLLAVSGAALLLSLFLPWYGVAGDASRSAWEAFASIDVVLLVCALVALAVPVVAATQKTVALPIAFTALATLFCLAALVLVLARIVFEPAGADSIRAGAWVALAAAGAMTVGAWIAVRDERLSRPGESTDVTGRPAPPPPEVDAIPPPRPSG